MSEAETPSSGEQVSGPESLDILKVVKPGESVKPSTSPPVISEPVVPLEPVPPLTVSQPVSPVIPPVTPEPTEVDLAASDRDVIEPVWVKQAETIIKEDKENPHKEVVDEENLQQQYLKTRFGKEIKPDQEAK